MTKEEIIKELLVFGDRFSLRNEPSLKRHAFYALYGDRIYMNVRIEDSIVAFAVLKVNVIGFVDRLLATDAVLIGYDFIDINRAGSMVYADITTLVQFAFAARVKFNEPPSGS